VKTAGTCFTTWATTQLSAPFAKHPSSLRNRNRSQSQRPPIPGGASARSPSLFQSRCTLTPGLGRFSPTASVILCYAQPKCPVWFSLIMKKQGIAGAPVSSPCHTYGTVSARTLSLAKVREASQWAAYQNHQDHRRNHRQHQSRRR